MTDLRAFSAKKQKTSAAEIRRQLAESSTFLSSLDIEARTNNLRMSSKSLNQCVSSSDVATPVDIEDILSSRSIKRLEIKLGSNRIQRISDYNEKDVSIRSIPREKVFLPDILPAISNENVKPHIRDLISNFEKDSLVVERHYRQFSSADALERLSYLTLTRGHQVFELDLDGDDKKQQPVHRSISQIEEPSSKRISSISNASTEAVSSFSHQDQMLLIPNSNLPGLFDNNAPSDKHRFSSGPYLVSLLPNLSKSNKKTRSTFELPPVMPTEFLSITFKSLRLEPYFEPIFGCAYFFDLQTKSRLTENFYFDFNSLEILGLIRAHIGIDEQPFKVREALLNAEHFGTNVFLIIRLEKILQASDITEAIDPYVSRDKPKEKLIYNAKEFCDRLGSYRMPIGWNFVELRTLLQAPFQQKTSDAYKSEETVSISSKQADTASIISVDRLSGSTNDTLYQATVVSQGDSSSGKTHTNPCPENDPLSFCQRLSAMTSYRHFINAMIKCESERLSDEDIAKILAEYQKSGSSRLRLKSYPVELSLELSIRKSDEIHDFLSTELLLASDFVADTSDKAREVLVFPHKKTFHVHSFYRNLLFIYPRSVNFASRSGNYRNITIRIELLDSKHNPQKVFFGKSRGAKMLSRVHTAVLYHNKTPQFADEIKAEIPVDLNDGHYILFTFFHISCKTNKQQDLVETPIGYTWYPLYLHNELQTGHKNLPISLETPPQGITYISPTNHVPNIKWLENHRSLFDVSFHSVSTVHPEDSFLTEFLRCFHSIRSNSKTPVTEQELQSSVRNITKSSPEKLAAYLYVVFDKLISLISSPLSESLSSTCFDVLCQLVKLAAVLFDGKTDSNARCALLSNYVVYHHRLNDNLIGLGRTTQRDSETLINLIRKYEQNTSIKTTDSVDINNKKLLHEELIRLFVKMPVSLRDQTCNYAWFFTELISKSVVEYLSTSNRFVLPRKLRLRRDEFLESVSEMCDILISETIERASKNLTQADSINTALAYFIFDSFGTMDRSLLFKQIAHYNKTMIDKIRESTEPLQTTLMTLKLNFLQIVCSHEHFVILNLPFEFQATQSLLVGLKSSVSLSAISNQPTAAFPSTILQTPSSPSGSSSLSSKSSNTLDDTDLNANYRAKHFLSGLVLSDLALVLSSTNTLIHSKAIELVSCLLAVHEIDERLTDNNVWLRNRVTLFYLPLIQIVMDARSSLYDPYGRNSNLGGSNLSSSHNGYRLDPKIAGSIAGLDRLPIEHNAVAGLSKLHLKQSGTLSKQLTAELLACFCWVLKNVDRPVLFKFLHELPLQRMQQFIDIIHLCISIFEYKPSTGSFLSDTDRRHSNGVLEEIGTIRGPKTSGNCGSIRWRNNATDMTGSRYSAIVTSGTGQSTETAVERELATESSLTLLDTLVTVIRVITLPELDHFLFILPSVFRTLMHMLKCNQSSKTLENAFVVQRAFVSKFPELIFEQQSDLCAELCIELLRYMGSKQPVVRSQSASSLYFLMRQNFEHNSLNFSRLKMQITTALSTLVANVSSFGLLNEDNIRHSLKAIISYMKHDAITNNALKDTSFNNQVTTMIFNLSTIIMDTCQMKNYTDDFEMLIDLMYRIAKGYQNNPDLRLTWLLNISQKHLAVQNYAEAAQCLLHASALSCEYMSLRSLNETIPEGASAFKGLSLNIDDECALEDTVDPHEEGICESTHFTIDGLLQLIDKTADLFEKSGQYELISKLYKVVEPILEEKRNFSKLSRVHACICHALQKVEDPIYYNENGAFPSLLPTDKRAFGTYFRVGFYGHKFGDLNATEFVYKEPFFTKLPEISHRLEAYYATQMGKNSVEIIKDSSDVDPKKLDQNKAYLQITYIEPYFDAWELRRRTSYFYLNYGLSRFVYATPFTKDGRAHGSLEHQYKKRTILSTKHSFPYLKTRIRVVDREQRILTPIEVAIEDLEKKTRELCAATKIDDAKMLQMVLQGCIATTINEGPIQIARVFLSKIETDEHGKPVDPLQNKLRLGFKDFSKKCSDALQKNEMLISADQHDYQKELRRNFFEFTQQLAQIITGPTTDLTQKLHINRDNILPINLHAFTSSIISSGGVGQISSV